MRRGGKRRGAGRKPKIPGRPGVSHGVRPTLNERWPVHVTLRVHEGVPNLRREALRGLLMAAMRAGCSKKGFRVCQFVIMGNHMHLIVEADDARALARGMQGLGVRLARRVNAAVGRKGRFFEDRYHAHVLRTPTEVHRALTYVLLNQRKHAAERQSHHLPVGVDAFSSGPWWDGWAVKPRGVERLRAQAPPVAAATTWLLSVGWRKVGSIVVPG